MKRITLLAYLIIILVAFPNCARQESEKPQKQEVNSPEPRFDIKNLKIDADEESSFTVFNHRGTLLVIGDEKMTKKNYLVVLKASLISGGNHNAKTDYPKIITVPVLEGSGDIFINAGIRRKKTAFQEAETWTPPTVEVKIIGYTELKETSNTAVKTQ